MRSYYARYFDPEYDPHLLHLPYEKFLKEPEQSYDFTLFLRVPSHDSYYDDQPFRDRLFLNKIGMYIDKLNRLNQGRDYIHIYIPDNNDRNIEIMSDSEETCSETALNLHRIASTYASGKLASIHPIEMALNQVNRAKQEAEQKSNRIKNAAREEINPGRIVFDADISLRSLDGIQKASYQKLSAYFREQIGVSITPSRLHDNCADMIGASTNVHIAYLIGRKAVQKIQAGDPITVGWLKGAHRHATARVTQERINDVLQGPIVKIHAIEPEVPSLNF